MQVGETVPGRKSVEMTVARVQGNGCDGENGVFGIQMSNLPNEVVYFVFDNEGIMSMRDASSASFGTLSPKSPLADGSYTWETISGTVPTAAELTNDEWLITRDDDDGGIWNGSIQF